MLRLDRLVSTTRLRKSVAAERLRRLQRAQRRLVAKVDLAVALVAGDHEAVAVAQFEQLLPLGQRHHRAGRVARRADVEQLRARPGGGVDAVPVGGEVARRVAVGEGRLRAGQQRRAFVDLIEGIRADHGRAGLRRVDHGLRQREQRLARAVDRQHLRGWVERHAVAPLHPAARSASRSARLAGGGRVARQAVQSRDSASSISAGVACSRLADAQADRPVRRRGRDAGGQRAQALERVGVQARQQRVHALDDRRPSSVA